MKENPELAECKRERDSAFETLNKDQAEYDKQLLALSAAFLGISLAFIKDVVPLKDAAYLWELDLALGCLLGCVCLVLWSFQYSIHGHLRLADYWELREKMLRATGDEQAKISEDLGKLWTWLRRKADKIKGANVASGVLFALGTILLVIFVTTNVYRAAHSGQGSNGQTPKQAVPKPDAGVHP